MINIKPGSPAHAGYIAALDFDGLANNTWEPTSPYQPGTNESAQWHEEYQTELRDLTTLDHPRKEAS